MTRQTAAAAIVLGLIPVVIVVIAAVVSGLPTPVAGPGGSPGAIDFADQPDSGLPAVSSPSTVPGRPSSPAATPGRGTVTGGGAGTGGGPAVRGSSPATPASRT